MQQEHVMRIIWAWTRVVPTRDRVSVLTFPHANKHIYKYIQIRIHIDVASFVKHDGDTRKERAVSANYILFGKYSSNTYESKTKLSLRTSLRCSSSFLLCAFWAHRQSLIHTEQWSFWTHSVRCTLSRPRIVAIAITVCVKYQLLKCINSSLQH